MSRARAITAIERFAVYWAWNGRCFWCREPIKFADCHIDHVIPVSASAAIEDLRYHYSLSPQFEIDGFENWVPACQRCNLLKRSMVLVNSPAVVLHLQAVRERAAKARLSAEQQERDRRASLVLAKMLTGAEPDDSEINVIGSLVPLPAVDVQVSEKWEIQQREGKVIVVQLSPLYSAEGRKQFRASQGAIRQQINLLSSRSARLDADMANLDSTTVHWQALSREKADVELELTRLKPLLATGGFGFTGHLDR